jgi:hypothetical protein
MKLFKTIDVVLQLFLLLLLIFSSVKDFGNKNSILYVIVFGVYQVLSSLIQLFLKPKKTWWRIAYSLAGVLILLLFLGMEINLISLDNVIGAMFLLTPAMALYYVVLSIIETIQLYKTEHTQDDLID